MKMNNIYSPLDEKILSPLIKASGLSPKDAQTFKRELVKIAVSEAIIKAIEALPGSEKQKTAAKLKKEVSDQERFKILQENIKDSPQAQKALKEYLKKDLPEFIEELAIAFAEKTTPEKRKEFLGLLSQE